MEHQADKSSEMEADQSGLQPLLIAHLAPKAGRPREIALDDPTTIPPEMVFGVSSFIAG